MSHSVAGFGAIEMRSWGDPSRGRANVDAADGILVVQIRRVRAISREVFQLAAALITLRGAHMRQWRVGLPAHGGKPSFPGSRFLLADQLLAISRSAAHGVALFPRQKLVRRP